MISKPSKSTALNPQIFAIYDAESTLMGEIQYVFGKIFGQSGCALCDLSHGWNPLGKREWRNCNGPAARLTWVHRDELPLNILPLVEGQLPCVAMKVPKGVKIVIDRSELLSCNGNFALLEQILERRLDDL